MNQKTDSTALVALGVLLRRSRLFGKRVILLLFIWNFLLLSTNLCRLCLSTCILVLRRNLLGFVLELGTYGLIFRRNISSVVLRLNLLRIMPLFILKKIVNKSKGTPRVSQLLQLSFDLSSLRCFPLAVSTVHPDNRVEVEDMGLSCDYWVQRLASY